LLLADEGQGDPPIARDVGVCLSLPARVRRQYCQEGLQACLREKPRSGRPRAFSGHGEAALTVLACSDPPDGRCRWTHRLLADRVVELELLDSVAHTTIGRLLKKTT
jgi:transposase